MFREKFRTYADLDVASAVDVINDLGFDTLTFLVVTVMVVPAFRILKASPVSNFSRRDIIFASFSLFYHDSQNLFFACNFSLPNFVSDADLEGITSIKIYVLYV